MASSNGTIFMGPTANSLADAAGNLWGITADRQVVKYTTNSTGQITATTVDAQTDHVIALAYANDAVWQENTSLLWYKQIGNAPGNYDGWAPGTKTTPVPPSKDGSVVLAGGFSSSDGSVYLIHDSVPTLVDSHGNLWDISNGQVMENGVIDQLTDHVVAMTYINNQIWQENTSNLWYAKVGDVPGSYDGWSAGTLVAPIPTYKTWVGGGDNSASDPSHWSQPTQPIAGDYLRMNGGVMNVSDNVLAADTVAGPFTGNTVVNTFNVTGNSNFSVDGQSIVNLADGSKWTGGISIGPYTGGTVVKAVGSGTLSNSVSSVDNALTIDADVIGAGKFSVSAAHNQGKLEFMRGVSSDQTITLNGAGYGLQPAIEQVDNLKDFHALTNLGFGEVILKAITADSYSYKSDVLSLYKGDTKVGSLNLHLIPETNTTQSGIGFGVSQVGGSVIVHTDLFSTSPGSSGSGYYSGGGTLLSLHA